MPLFDYHCTECAAEFELLVRQNDSPVCPSCGGTRLDKLVSRIAPHLRSPGLKRAMRAQAKREGHLSNF